MENQSDDRNFDIIVVGGGHAGIEAALAGARIGFKTLVLTINLDTIGLMPCNPSIGGPGKGHLVREIDALGGQIARTTDKSYIHIRNLNTSKGPAVRALRCQSDKYLYSKIMKHVLEKENKLFLRQGMVKKLIFDDSLENETEYNEGCDTCSENPQNGGKNVSVAGVQIETGEEFFAPTVIITTGTFLNGLIHIGDTNYEAGRLGEFASKGLTDSLIDAGIEVNRFKTGTVARVDFNSINLDKCIEQKPSEVPLGFSYFTERCFPLKQRSCWITYTNSKTHEIIKSSFDRSPLFSGKIMGIGPKYCPSIEDKVNRFEDRDRHPVFIEPEGEGTIETYLQGLSTSLPMDVQYDMLKSIDGLENVNILRPGYAVEYDCVNTLQLYHSLMSKQVNGLFFAGQINGTSGYEEAAAQGLVAGINATAYLKDMKPMIIGRDQGYIGVLIDDLVTKGTNEPYRIFTSRVEYRMSCRFDNADTRLSKTGNEYGLLNNDDYSNICERQAVHDEAIKSLKTFHVKQNVVNESLKSSIGKSYADVLKCPNIVLSDIADDLEPIRHMNLNDTDMRRVEIEIKYEGYIKKQLRQIDEVKRLETKNIPADLNYDEIKGLSNESIDRLKIIRPATVGQASRIQGVSPSDIAVLIYALKRQS